MNATADVLPDLRGAAERVIERSRHVLSFDGIERIYTPYEPGEATEVLFIGRVKGMRQCGPLTAWLSDEPPGFRAEIRVEEGW